MKPSNPNMVPSDLFGIYCIPKRDIKVLKHFESGIYGISSSGIHLPSSSKIVIKQLLFMGKCDEKMCYICMELVYLMRAINMFLATPIGYSFSRPLSIITPEYKNGSLYNLFHDSHKTRCISGTEKTIIAMGIAYGMKRLHKLKIIHGDLRSQNVLIDSKGYPVLTDFGIQQISQKVGIKLKGRTDAKYWYSPELFVDEKVSYESDVYAYGVLLMEMLTESVTYQTIELSNVLYDRKEKPFILTDAPPMITALIMSCLNHKSTSRPSFKQIYNLFRNCLVSFAGSSKDHITQFHQIIKNNRHTKKNSFTHLNNASLPARNGLMNIFMKEFRKISEQNASLSKKKFLRLPKHKVFSPKSEPFVKDPKIIDIDQWKTIISNPSDIIALPLKKGMKLGIFMSRGITRIETLIPKREENKTNNIRHSRSKSMGNDTDLLEMNHTKIRNSLSNSIGDEKKHRQTPIPANKPHRLLSFGSLDKQRLNIPKAPINYINEGAPNHISNDSPLLSTEGSEL